MSRIRSIHPGIWTDEAFMGLSAYARLLLIGIWTEAWDDGVFEWKPLTLKARLFPVDMVDVNELLQELLEAGVIARMDEHEKRPGIVRNFQRYQRPKKPNSSQLMTNRWLEYVGKSPTKGDLNKDSSEPVPNQFPTDTENPIQMEDGGWRMEDGNGEDVANAPSLPERPSSKKPVSTKAEDVLNELRKVLDEDRARAVVEHRKGFKAKFTAYAAKLLAAKFAKCPDPNAAADTMIANGWQGFEVDWLDRHTNRDGRLGRAQQKPSERYDPFKALAQEMQDEQNGRDSSSSGDWDDAEGVPILTIDYDGR